MNHIATSLICTIVLMQSYGVARTQTDKNSNSNLAAENAKILKQFRKLSSGRRGKIIREVSEALEDEKAPALKRILRMLSTAPSLPKDKAKPIIDKRSPSGQTVKRGSNRHKRFLKEFPDIVYLPELGRNVRYDWHKGRATRTAKALKPEQAFANYLNGFPNGSGVLLATITETLDTDREMRKAAEWFGHRYLKRSGISFEGVDQYQAWYSKATAEIPDNEAIRFARSILGDPSYKKPLGGTSRALLYKKMGASALGYRRYRVVREILSALFLTPTPGIDPVYEPLLPRFRFLLQHCRGDLAKLLEVIEGKERNEIIAWIDERMTKRGPEVWGSQTAEMNRVVRRTAIRVFQANQRR